MSKSRETELRTQLGGLTDEYEALHEELSRLESDDPEVEFLNEQLEALEITMGTIEEELELLR